MRVQGVSSLCRRRHTLHPWFVHNTMACRLECKFLCASRAVGQGWGGPAWHLSPSCGPQASQEVPRLGGRAPASSKTAATGAAGGGAAEGPGCVPRRSGGRMPPAHMRASQPALHPKAARPSSTAGAGRQAVRPSRKDAARGFPGWRRGQERAAWGSDRAMPQPQPQGCAYRVCTYFHR